MTQPTTRDRMISTAMRLFRREGYTATSWRRLVEEAGTPWGSAYHHFPGGKEELGVAAIALGTELVTGTIRRAFERHSDPADAIRWWFGKAAAALEREDFRGGCPVATVALEMAHGSDALTTACQEAFEAWRVVLTGFLRERGFEAARANRLAMSVMNNLEGGLLACRVRRGTTPLERAAEDVAVLLGA
ncbi:TetR/AcrR family transcriptional regulator [Amycolatopsis minnesotensis]|uniref:TetR/AcrR family transcriptional regulator n=1 Tax=Amycolatopsis minnesotensis TaxID=337894 RepID=A0ABP5BH59_9PSEU